VSLTRGLFPRAVVIVISALSLVAATASATFAAAPFAN
jgi:hypothetical protein